jgi:hypothetical protein
LKKHVLELTWKKYQDNIPELLKRLRTFKKKSETNLEHIQAQLKSLESNTLRGNAARYAMHFLQNIEKLLTGTLEGNPSINGQALDEEKAQDGKIYFIENLCRDCIGGCNIVAHYLR